MALRTMGCHAKPNRTVSKQLPVDDVTPPSVVGIPQGLQRPHWSVMIPTFNCANYLRQTLESVLKQDPGPEWMQIEVVDDCSTKDDPMKVVSEVGKGRVQFFRKPQNEGAIRNFNTCIERSRGELLHILHGDDWVLPGFYSRVEEAFRLNGTVAAVFARCFQVDGEGALETLSARVAHLETPGTDPGELTYCNKILTPGVVVLRSFYEAHGGFRPSLIHTADWEMWIRAIRRAGALFLNESLAAYREFSQNDTGRLARTAENLRDYLRAGRIFAASYPGFDETRFKKFVAGIAARQRDLFQQRGDADAARANDQIWCELTPRAQIVVESLKKVARRVAGRWV